MSFFFHSEVSGFKFKDHSNYKQWLKKVIYCEKKKIGEINIIFISDEDILKINNSYLKNDFYTDIIAFNYNEKNKISGDIFISIERVKENAKEFGEKFENELNRVIVHGVLHLIGYDDKKEEEKKIIRNLENHYLSMYS